MIKMNTTSAGTNIAEKKSLPRWRLTPSWQVAIKALSFKCSFCGTTERLEIHHKDGNTKNNKVENLQVVCHYCHMNEAHKIDEVARQRWTTPTFKEWMSLKQKVAARPHSFQSEAILKATDVSLRCKCLRCGHIWITKTPQVPRVCPKCKNPNWFRPKSRGQKRGPKKGAKYKPRVKK